MRKLAVFTGSFSLGIFLAQYLIPFEELLYIALSLFLASAVFLFAPYECRRRGILICTALAISFGYHWLYCRQVERPMEEAAGTEQQVVMTLCDYATVTEYGARATVRIVGLPAKVAYYGDETLLDLQPGQTVKDDVYFQSASKIRDHEITTFTSKGIFLLGYSRGNPEAGDGNSTAVRWWPIRLGQMFREQIFSLFEEDTAAFLNGVLTGDRSALSKQADNDLAEAGLSHIMAVSGMHCGFLLGILMLIFGAYDYASLITFGIPILAFYAVMTGGSPSVVRSCIMIAFSLVGPYFKRSNDWPTSLCTALFLILLQNPFAAASISLQLSFAAIAGVMWLAPKVYSGFLKGKRRKRLTLIVTASFASTLGALVFSAPVSAHYFGTLPLVSPVSNLLCLWAVSAAFVLGLAVVLLSFIMPALAGILALLPTVIVQYILTAAHYLAKIPYHAVYFTNPYLKYWLIFTYALFAVAYFRKLRKNAYWIPVAAAIGSLVLVIHLGAIRYGGALETIVLDAGQGQCVVLGSEDGAVLVDCGSANSWYDAGNDAADLLLTMGYREIEAVIITHYDADHVNGISDLLTRMPVKELYLPADDDEDGWKDLLMDEAARYQVSALECSAPAQIRIGGSVVQILPSTPAVKDDNESGLAVLATEKDWDMLITGDMNRASEKRLLSMYELPDIEVLVAGHHGAVGSTSPELLDTLGPETICISVGDNSYGHPGEDMLRRLAERSCMVYRTDYHGNIRLSVN